MSFDIWETGVNNDGNGTDNNQYYISDTSSLIKRLTIQRGTGTVGIDTNTPISIIGANVKLDVNGSINLTENIYKNGQPYVSNSTTWIENETKTKIYYMSGNVGINTDDPMELLDVNGTIKSTNIIANGSGLTNLNASEIATENINTDRLPETISVYTFIGSGVNLTNLNANNLNITLGKINDYVLPSTIEVLSLEGDGQGLNNLDASKFTSGNINNIRLPANISVSTLTGSGTGITNLQANNISGKIHNDILPTNISVTSLTGIGSNITELNASEIKTGKITSSIFLPDNINVNYLSGNGYAISNLDASKITQGKLNNNLFNNDISITGKLTVNNLSVSGTSAIINSENYNTENLEIINNNASEPSLIINHNSTFNDLMRILSNNTRIFTIFKDGNVGIGGTAFPNSNYKLDVEGNINSSGTISSDIVLIKDNINFYKSSTQSVLIKLPQTLTSYTITLPNSGPSANNILKSDSNGNLSWVNINESPTLENVYSFFNNTEFEKTTSNIRLKNINSSKLISTFNSTQFELPPNGEPQIIRIKEDVLTNLSITSLKSPYGDANNEYNFSDITFLDVPNIVFEESIERMYPPVRNFTQNSQNISGQSYGNGIYIISTSSFYNETTEASFNIVNGTNVGWTQQSNSYTGVGGLYAGNYSLAGYSGEWVKIKLPVKINLTKYAIQSSSIGGVNRAPSIYKIFGSNDDIYWSELIFKSTALTTSSYVSDIFQENVTTSGTYSYFAIVINKNMGLDSWLSIGEFTLYGKELNSLPKQIPIDKYILRIFTFEGTSGSLSADGTQRIHSINFPENVVADILVVGGGGGGGGNLSGGGGAGGMVISTGVSLSGNYTIKVGKGGNAGYSAEDGESDGRNSEIFSGNDYNSSLNKIKVYGGGGGGHEFLQARDNGNNGGCGGGGRTNASTEGAPVSLGGSITPAEKSGIFSQGVSYGNSGGNGSIQDTTSNNEGSGGGGGCGIGQVGGTGVYRSAADTSVSLGGKGGDGFYVGNIFGNNIGVNGWVGGGGAGGSFSMLSSTSFQENTGGQGGGGRGGRDHNNAFFVSSTAGINGTGGGGGGGSFHHPYGSNGGSGIVIIRYYVVSSITHKYLALTNLNNPYPVLTADSTNLVAHYKFDDDTNIGLNSATSINSIGNTTYNGTPTLSSSEYVIGKSSYFLGSGDHSFVLDNNTNKLYNAIYQKPITISFWCKTLGAGQFSHGRVFYGAPTGLANDVNSFQCVHWGGTEDGQSDNTQLTFIISNNGESYTGNFMYSTKLPAYNTSWSHIAFVIEPQSTNWTTKEHTAKIYVNGVLDKTYNNIWYPLITQNYDFEIGRWTTNEDSREYNGYLDDFRIYNKSLSQTEVSTLYTNINNIPTTYQVNFPVNTTCDILAINNSQYIKTSGVILNGSYNVVVGSTSKIQQNSTDLYVPNTNLNITDSITGTSIIYTTNNPIIIIRYEVSIVENVLQKGYLKFDNNIWNVEDSGILTSKVLHNELCMTRYLSSNKYAMINIYEYNVVNDNGVSSNWITINNDDIISLSKSGSINSNNLGSILKIKLKYCSLENVYNSFLVDHYLYIHKIKCTIKNRNNSILYTSGDIIINKETFFSEPDLFIGGVNLMTNQIPTNILHILELKLSVSFDASIDSTNTIKEQTDKFYLFYENI